MPKMGTKCEFSIIRGKDNAIWNRLRLIPFSVTIPKDEQDRHLVKKLKDEGHAILAWAIYGAKHWFDDGLGKPPEIDDAVSNWRAESDPLKDFIPDRCEIYEGAQCGVGELRKAYLAWCRIADP